MGIQEQAKTSGGRAEHIWFQLVYSDRFLSLMIGCPFVIAEKDPLEDSEARDMTSSQRLERLHIEIAERIILRNLKMRHDKDHHDTFDHCYDDYDETNKIDKQLKKAAKLLPPSWWLRFSGDNEAHEFSLLEKVGKLLIQLHHYYLIIHLHQPYLIQLLTQRHGSEASGWHAVNHTYSKLAAASAGREALSQYFTLRELSQSPSYRLVDEKMYFSTVALLFAHFDGHRHGNVNVLDHQRLHDLGLITESASLLERIATRNEDSKGLYLVRILRALMVIEDKVSEGCVYYVWNDQHVQADYGNTNMLNRDILSFFVPYFGMVYFSREEKEFFPNAEGNDVRGGYVGGQGDTEYQIHELKEASRSAQILENEELEQFNIDDWIQGS